MEGHRWWDLRRLTLVKDGAQTDHLVFQPQGCIGYGLNPVDNAWMVENDGSSCSDLGACSYNPGSSQAPLAD